MKREDVWPDLLRIARARRAMRSVMAEDSSGGGSTTFAPTLPAHLRARFVERAEVYPVGPGWCFRILISTKHIPPGGALSFGTPPNMILSSRDAALMAGAALAELMVDLDDKDAIEATKQSAQEAKKRSAGPYRLH
jgi:hypothetical protein